MSPIFEPTSPRCISLTDRGLRAIGVQPVARVPLIKVNWLKADLEEAASDE